MTIAYWESDDNSFIPKHSITTDMYKAQSVDTSALSDNSVTSDKLGDNSVTSDKLGDNSVTADKLGEDVTEVINNLLDKAWPVGAIYTSTVPTYPDTLFGFGQWEYIEQGRVLLSQGSRYEAGTTGGEESHKLTTDELAPHSHSFSGNTSSDGSHTHQYTLSNNNTGGEGALWSDRCSAQNNRATSTNGNHTHSFSGTTSTVGGNNGHNNMQPYLSVYMWKRTA